VYAVSVLIPTFERPDLLEVALESAIEQSFDDIEILVGDNSDSDDTENLVSNYDDPRIRYHRNRPGLGPQGNWLDLASRAEAPLVASLHDDDYWHPEFLATMAPPMLEDPSIAMTFCDFWIVDETGSKLFDLTDQEAIRTHRSVMAAGNIDPELERGLRMVAVWNAPQPAYAAVVRRREIVECEFPDDTVPLYDIWLSYQLVRKKKKIRYEPSRLTYYRQHSGSLTSDGFSKAEDAVFERIMAENQNLAISDEIFRYWSSLRWSRATEVWTAGGSVEWARQEMKAAKHGLDGWKYLVASGVGGSQLLWKAAGVGKRLGGRLR